MTLISDLCVVYFIVLVLAIFNLATVTPDILNRYGAGLPFIKFLLF
jgi:hypothetical protein